MNSTQAAYEASVPSHLRSWDLADPARLLRELAAARPLGLGTSYLCQVREPATHQRLVSHTHVWRGRPPQDHEQRREDVEAAMRRLGHRDFRWDDDARLTSAVAIVVVRDGPAVPRRSDYDVLGALRYANNPFQALTSDLVVLTPHGWIALPDRLAGTHPTASLRGS